MTFHRLRRPFVVWLALLIAVFGALAPALSLATNSTRVSMQAVMEICSSSGLHRPSADTATGSPSEPATGIFVNHCPLCLHHADRVAPPPTTADQAFGVPGDPVAPMLGQLPPFITRFAPAPPPRGPPASS